MFAIVADSDETTAEVGLGVVDGDHRKVGCSFRGKIRLCGVLQMPIKM